MRAIALKIMKQWCKYGSACSSPGCCQAHEAWAVALTMKSLDESAEGMKAFSGRSGGLSWATEVHSPVLIQGLHPRGVIALRTMVQPAICVAYLAQIMSEPQGFPCCTEAHCAYIDAGMAGCSMFGALLR